MRRGRGTMMGYEVYGIGYKEDTFHTIYLIPCTQCLPQ